MIAGYCCSTCEGTNLIATFWEDAGASLDAHSEMFAAEGVKCLDCGATAEEADPIPELATLADMLLQLAEAPVGAPPPELVPIRKPATREILSPRQMEIAALVAKGRTNKEIAKAQGLAENTVRSHLQVVFEKLEIENRVQLALWYLNGRAA